MKTVYNILMVCLLFINCDNANDLNIGTFCSVENPIEELAWLKNEIDDREQNITESSKYLYIMQSTHSGETIIIYGNCDPLINSVYPVYNCNGEFIGIIGQRIGDIPFEVLSAGQTIWNINDFACDF